MLQVDVKKCRVNRFWMSTRTSVFSDPLFVLADHRLAASGKARKVRSKIIYKRVVRTHHVAIEKMYLFEIIAFVVFHFK